MRYAILIDGKVDEIVDRIVGRQREFHRVVDVTDRPDIVVGSTWPFSKMEDYLKTVKGGE
jgi:hypothetical protein